MEAATGLKPLMPSYVRNCQLRISTAASCFISNANFKLSHKNVKIAFRMPYLSGCQFWLQRKNGFYRFGQLTKEIKGKKGVYRVVSCQLAGAANPSLPSLADQDASSLGPTLRGICFYTVACVLAIPLFVVMLLAHPFVLLFDKQRRKVHHLVNKVWASLALLLFCKVDIVGLENLPPPNVPAVYVSNHQSYLDIFALLLLGRSFKFISKISIFFIPIVGWAMFLTGHIPLRRMDNKSQMECLKRCLNVLRQGASVMFFPEGTRTKDGKMAAFKKGAFSMAAKAKVPIVPITLIGTGNVMPNGKEGSLRKGSLKIIIHPPIEGTDADELSEKARAVIAEQLILHGYGVR